MSNLRSDTLNGSEVMDLLDDRDPFSLSSGNATGNATGDAAPFLEEESPYDRAKWLMNEQLEGERSSFMTSRGKEPNPPKAVQSTTEPMWFTPDDEGQLPDDEGQLDVVAKEFDIAEIESWMGGNVNDSSTSRDPVFKQTLTGGPVEDVEPQPRPRHKRTPEAAAVEDADSKHLSNGRKKLCWKMIWYTTPHGRQNISELRNNVSQAKGLEQYTFVHEYVKEKLVCQLGEKRAGAQMPEMSAFSKSTKKMARQTLWQAGFDDVEEMVEDMIDAAKKAQSDYRKPTRSWGEEAMFNDCTAFSCIMTQKGESLRGTDNPPSLDNFLLQSSHPPCPNYTYDKETQDAAKCHPSCSACFTQFMRDQAAKHAQILRSQASSHAASAARV